MAIAALAMMALPVSEASAGLRRECKALICVNIEDLPGSAERVARFSSSTGPEFNHFNVLFKSSGNAVQVEVEPGAPWHFSIEPGQVVKFAVQGCLGGFGRSSTCTAWTDFAHRRLAEPPPAAGPSDKEKAAAPIPKIGKGLASPGGIAAAPSGFQADLAVTGLAGPGSLKAGLSGSYTVAVKNTGNAAAAVELDIHFAGKLDQTGQITAGAGLSCVVRPVKGVNLSVHCTGGRLGGEELATVTVQGRGQEAGPGQVIATVNNSRAVKESDYNNNLKQLNVTIN